MPTVHLVCRPAAGGIRTHLVGLLTELPNLGWTTCLHAPKDLLASLSTEMASGLSRELGIESGLSPSDFPCSFRLASQLPNGSLVHAHGIRAAWICLLARQIRPFRLLVTLHNTPPNTFAGQLVLFLIKRSSDRIVCVSEAIARQVGSSKAVVVPNGLDFQTEQRLAHDDSEQQPIWREGAFRVICASRLSSEKGIDLLIHAAKQLPSVHFVIAGGGPLKDDYISFAPSNVTFLGYRSDVARLIRSADCYVSPSRSEGQGISVLEAFVAETPVAASSVGGIPESVVDQVTGLLFQPESVSSIVLAIETIRRNPEQAKARARQAKVWVMEHRDRIKQTQELVKVYEQASKTTIGAQSLSS